MDVSLYIPCFNAAKTIKPCLEAVLKQSYPIKEIIIVDDASVDATVDIVSRYPVRLIKQKHNQGLAAARNVAVKQIKTEYIASVDADCLIDSQWLKKLMGEFKSSKIAGAGGRLLEKETSSIFDLWRSVHMKQFWTDAKTEPRFLFGSNTVFRKKALLAVNLYNLELKNNYEDVDICRKLKNKGYGLSYQPKATVSHLKKDNLYSVLNTFWNWHLEFYRQKKYYADEKVFIFKLNDNLGLANRYLSEDLSSKRYQLLYLDFLLALHHCVKDFQYYISHNNYNQEEPNRLSSWLTLLDLTFFQHFDSDKKKLGTMMTVKNKVLQNFLALNLVLGKFIQGKFKNTEFLKILYKHLLISVYKIEDNYLLDKISNLSLLHNDWSSLYNKKHPYLNPVFLEKLSFNFKRWMKLPIFDSCDLINLIKLSAIQTDKMIN